MAIRVYNTLTRKKEQFEARDSGKAAIYICGPTVYNFIHIGNARCYVAFDAVVRYLEFSGYKVTYVRNLTDVDDKIINRAKEEGTTPADIAAKYGKAFHEDMDALGCRKPDIEPTATETIPDMLNIIEGLIEKGIAYEVDGDVFFDVTKFKDYGKLSGRSLEEMRAGQRVEIDPRKHHPMDFALWKRAKEGEPSWSSPWGQGRPGWHIECSAMSLSHLGMGFDIHGGGQDLIFPHHENERAQSEAYAGTQPFVRYWLHNGFVTIKAEKMAKSVGNVTLVHEISKWEQYAGKPVDLHNDLRMFFLSTHYRSPIDFSEEHLLESGRKVKGLAGLLFRIDYELKNAVFGGSDADEDEEALAKKIADTKEKFTQAMDDDFNTPAAIGVLFELEKEVNRFTAKHQSGYSSGSKELLESARAALVELTDGVLGFDLEGALSAGEGQPVEAASSMAGAVEGLRSLAEECLGAPIEDPVNDTDLVEQLIERRQRARKEKDFSLADKIRTGLTEIGVVIEDTPHGARWKWK